MLIKLNLDVLGTIPHEERHALPNLERRAGRQLSVMIIMLMLMLILKTMMTKITQLSNIL